MSDEKSFSVCQEMLPLFRAVLKCFFGSVLKPSVAFSLFQYGCIHKSCRHFGGGRGLATAWTKVEMGGSAVSGHPFQCGLWKREGYLKVILSSFSCIKD